MKTVEKLHEEWKEKVEFYTQILTKIPVAESHYKQWIFIRNELDRALRMIELIEEHLL